MTNLQKVQIALAAVIALGGCGGKTVVQDRPIRFAVPVPAPCATTRPAAVPSLLSAYPDDQWQTMDVRQKAGAVGQNAVKLRTYGEQLDAATRACK